MFRAESITVHISPFWCVPFLVLFLAAGCNKKQPPPPPPEVQVITIQATNIPVFEEWIGTLDGFVNAGIRAQVTGYLMSQNYKEGSLVKKGDLLFQIDPRPFQASLDAAKARLAQSHAQQGKTQLDVKRYTPLVKEQAISQEELDNAVQANAGAEAQVKADESTVETAQLNLEFTRITSPIDGIAGTALAQVGDLLSPSSGLLTTVSTVNPIKVYFNVNEQSYLTFWKSRIAAGGDDSKLELDLILSDGSTYPIKGTVYYADRQVNQNTGTLQIVGLFENPDSLLRPGQYGRVRAQTRLATNVFVLPQRTITEMQGAYQVAVVDDQNKAHVKPVKVGPQSGGNWIIESGLTNGERVVVEGTLKAREGTPVAPKPYDPAADASTNAPAANSGSTNAQSQH
jgi:RND family efflux transporter MFP subunit